MCKTVSRRLPLSLSLLSNPFLWVSLPPSISHSVSVSVSVPRRAGRVQGLGFGIAWFTLGFRTKNWGGLKTFAFPHLVCDPSPEDRDAGGGWGGEAACGRRLCGTWMKAYIIEAWWPIYGCACVCVRVCVCVCVCVCMCVCVYHLLLLFITITIIIIIYYYFIFAPGQAAFRQGWS